MKYSSLAFLREIISHLIIYTSSLLEMTLQKDRIHYPAIRYGIILTFNPNSAQGLNGFLLKIKCIHLNTMPKEFKLT